MEAKKVTQSKGWRIWSITFLLVAGVILIFALGIGVGVRRATFSQNFNQNYTRNFGAEPAHGVVGKVVSLTGSSLAIEDSTNQESKIETNSATVIRYQDQQLAVTDIKVGDQVVILGNPTVAGTIQATLIRIFR